MHGLSRIAMIAVMSLGSIASGRQLYKYVEIPLPPGCVSGVALGVNEVGNVVGVGVRADNSKVGFFYEREGGTTHVIGELGKVAANAEIGPHSINDRNEVVGIMAVPATGAPHPFYWAPTESLTDFLYRPDDPKVNNGVMGMAYGINNIGWVAGMNTWNCQSAPWWGELVAVIWMDLSEPPSPVIGTSLECGFDGRLYDINNVGKMCGSFRSTSGMQFNRPVVISANERINLPTFGGTTQEHGYAYGINDAGIVCGESSNETPSGPEDGACYWIGSTIYRLDGWTGPGLARARAINNMFDIVGSSLINQRRALLWRNLGPASIDLNDVTLGMPVGHTLTTAEDISDSGYIVGRANEISSPRPFLLEPCDPVIVAGFGHHDVDVGATLTLEVDAGGASPLVYEWFHNFQEMADGPGPGGSVIFGTDGPLLRIEGVVPANAGRYEVKITSPCGEVISNAAIIGITTCPSDFDESGFVDSDDFTAFVEAFEAGYQLADYDGSGFVDLEDYIEFIEDFEVGC